jgi:hypothetical protein
MNFSIRFIAAVGCISLTAGVCAPSALATLIDFNDIPEGTPVSAGNPYAGILEIQARQGYQRIDDVVWSEASIQVGVQLNTINDARAGSSPLLAVYEPHYVPDGLYYYGEVTANFTRPVNDVSFDGFAPRGFGYQYVGINGAGETITLYGAMDPAVQLGDPLENVQRINLTLPAGYSLIQFKAEDRDPRPLDAGIWIDNIAFNVADAGSTCLLLALGCVGLTQIPLPDARCGSHRGERFGKKIAA